LQAVAFALRIVRLRHLLSQLVYLLAPFGSHFGDELMPEITPV
jgi:hypothetical protein